MLPGNLPFFWEGRGEKKGRGLRKPGLSIVLYVEGKKGKER